MKVQKFITSIGLCFFVALAGSLVTTPSIDTWYAGLQKPFFNPPNWIFGPVWTLLYLMMAISFYIVWEKGLDKKNVREGVRFFIIQLIFNYLWSFVFFAAQSPLLGLVVIVILWSAIFKTIVIFKKISKNAAYLLYPYLLWVSFATLLNLSILVLNP